MVELDQTMTPEDLINRYLARLSGEFSPEDAEAAIASASARIQASRRRKPLEVKPPEFDPATASGRLNHYLDVLALRFPPASIEQVVLSISGTIIGGRPRKPDQARRLKVSNCGWCGGEFTAKEMLVHRSRCKKRPRTPHRRAGRPPKLVLCRWCLVEMPTQDRVLHEPYCAKKPVRK